MTMVPQMTVPQLVVDIARAVQVAGGRTLLVGGYVRDSLMDRPSKDIDVEVYGIQPEALRTLLESFGPVNAVGASFGVYKIGDLDVSIPRTDSKTGHGHQGFTIQGDPFLSFREAFRRRDFTINAIGYDVMAGSFLDPFDGMGDIADGILRAVDPELFKDDSLRVLRGIQFAARFGFRMSIDTMQLCAGISLKDLPAERIWGEFEKLLMARFLGVGLRLASELGTIALWPELWSLQGCPQDPEWHPEGDVWTHTIQVLDIARTRVDHLSKPKALTVLLAALCHDFGKPLTTKVIDGRTRALGHEAAGVEPTARFLDRLNVHTMDGYDIRSQVLALVEHHLTPHAWY